MLLLKLAVFIAATIAIWRAQSKLDAKVYGGKYAANRSGVSAFVAKSFAVAKQHWLLTIAWVLALAWLLY